MGHGCHDCGSPNSCECPPWEEMRHIEERRKLNQIRSQDANAQRLLVRAQELCDEFSGLPHNTGVPYQTLRDRALVAAILERLV